MHSVLYLRNLFITSYLPLSRYLCESYEVSLSVSLTIKASIADVLEESFSFSGFHLWADRGMIWTQVPVHVMESMGHGIHCVNHKLHLSFLLITGVDPDALLA